MFSGFSFGFIFSVVSFFCRSGFSWTRTVVACIRVCFRYSSVFRSRFRGCFGGLRWSFITFLLSVCRCVSRRFRGSRVFAWGRFGRIVVYLVDLGGDFRKFGKKSVKGVRWCGFLSWVVGFYFRDFVR